MSSEKNTLVPSKINYRKTANLLELHYSDGTLLELEAELLRVYSPSADVRGHGEGNEVLQTGKKRVTLLDIKPAGSYAIKLCFDDGHDTGLYAWEYLYELGIHKEAFWKDYLRRIEEAGASREPSLISIKQL
ncbi:gamma-butyrobetaine hydroxylase-like domain-containing protein [Oceanospirillum maris]|jgi:DUF971 family protein|uniref:gamma-butyrobetaine hydroxylase-like domain-containing protein n=1 Tax=Oceanospirillum maris TaxID=64977 RepID=UPI00041073BF|nr:DUF971 domain-containing protein [Oceanospirillum maris]